MPKSKPIFITATDTGVGKTVATAVLGVLLQKKHVYVGAMKPVQCAGDDAQRLQEILALEDDMAFINPILAPEPLSPHLALRRAGMTFDRKKVKAALKVLQKKYDRVLIEGAGGLMVPLAKDYYTADLIKDLKADVIIVARLGLGTINHTLLTIHQAKAWGLKVKGIIFSDSNPKEKDLAEATNPSEIAKLTKIKVLGTIPYMKDINRQTIIKQCKNLKLSF